MLGQIELATRIIAVVQLPFRDDFHRVLLLLFAATWRDQQVFRLALADEPLFDKFVEQRAHVQQPLRCRVDAVDEVGQRPWALL